MCVDFTDLNLVFPKDPYLLPNISKLIDRSSRYKTLSFMDNYSNYKKIKINLMDVPRTAFTSNNCKRQGFFYAKDKVSSPYFFLMQKTRFFLLSRHLKKEEKFELTRKSKETFTRLKTSSGNPSCINMSKKKCHLYLHL